MSGGQVEIPNYDIKCSVLPPAQFVMMKVKESGGPVLIKSPFFTHRFEYDVENYSIIKEDLYHKDSILIRWERKYDSNN